ncbi:Ubiquitin carboxyl-terminal hydrolase 14 [Giardia muris]|uniref:ubiquitinyl hydrolase 1 n=1 Tax=Giardia muris TaxID=5742 RepID=A0A4Z1TAQ5_GIAMU|nr:Ubiquitin carboxyl-terminal hydrolase 14 [Giardia muris]|eukprot:TNJ30307.1 Ubiquitin carboxyl-terminal hydrolase 14 [Giardia muris]
MTSFSVYFNGVRHIVEAPLDGTVGQLCDAIGRHVNVPGKALCIVADCYFGSLLHDSPLKSYGIVETTSFYAIGSRAMAAVKPAAGEVAQIDEYAHEDSEGDNELKLSGIENLGNTCFFGAAIQVLFATERLRTVILSMLPTTRLGRLDHYIRMLVTVFESLATPPTTVNPIAFLNEFKLLHREMVELLPYGGYKQQDSQEALAYLLQDLAEAIPVSVLRATNAVTRDVLEFLELQSAIVTSLDSLEPRVMREGLGLNVIDSIYMFGLNYYHGTIGDTPVSTDMKYFLTLDITNAAVSLMDAIEQEFNEGKVQLDDMEVKRITRFALLPPVLYVHLKRFMWSEESQNRLKINRKVTFPMTLDLYQFCTETLKQGIDTDEDMGPSTYELTGILAHKGFSADSGHYVSYTRIPGAKNRWALLNDALAHEVSVDEIDKLAGGSPTFVAYVLVYTRNETKGCTS